MENVKVGFLPLYLELYDDIGERERADVDGYCDDVFAALAQTGIELVRADVCRIAPEVKAAVARFEAEQVDTIITLHLAYSPSLESIDAMAGTNLPIATLLEKYSEAGGTHHSALVYDVDAKSLALFAKTLGIKCTIL